MGRLSDERYAEERGRWLARKYGAVRIRHELRERGIGEETAARVSSGLDDLRRAKEILRRKYPNPASTLEERARRARFLASRGFSHEVIRRTLAAGTTTGFAEE